MYNIVHDAFDKFYHNEISTVNNIHPSDYVYSASTVGSPLQNIEHNSQRLLSSLQYENVLTN